MARRYAMTAPLGIKLLCALSLVIFPVQLYGRGTIVFQSAESGVAGWVYFAALIFLFLAIGRVIVIFGLWMLEPWGWRGGLFVYGLDIVFAILLFGTGYSNARLIAIQSFLILVYLFSKGGYYRERKSAPGAGIPQDNQYNNETRHQ